MRKPSVFYQRIVARLLSHLYDWCDMNLKAWFARVGRALVVLWVASVAAGSSLHNISYANLNLPMRSVFVRAVWAAEPSPAPPPAHPDTAAEARLKSALQKRLLVPNQADLSLGPVTAGPLKGLFHRTV